MTRLLLAVALAAAVAVGAWALFLRASDESHRLLVGALEDAVKSPRRRRLADERDRPGVSDAPASTRSTSRRSVDARPDRARIPRASWPILTERRRIGREAPPASASCSPSTPRGPRYAPISRRAAGANTPAFMATLARDLPSVRDFAVWNEPNLNGFWLYQFDESGQDIAAPRLHVAPGALLRRAQGRLAEDPRLRRIARAARRRQSRVGIGTRSLRPRSSATWAAPTAPAAGRSRSWTSSRSIRTSSARRCRRARSIRGERRSGSPTTTSSSRLLGEAFDGTAQPGSKLPIAYTEFGVQAKIPESAQATVHEPRLAHRDGRGRRGDAGGATTAQALELAACQPTVIAAPHLPPHRRARPGPLAVRPLLRRTRGRSRASRRSGRPRRRLATGKLATCS